MKLLEKISTWMGYVSAIFIFCLMLLITANVVGRHFLNSPITGSTELASLMMTVIVFPSLAWAALGGKHVRVDILVNRFSPRGQAIFDIAVYTVSLALYAIIAWRNFVAARQVTTITGMLRLPHAPFYWIAAIGLSVFCLAILGLLVRSIQKVAKNEP